MPSVLTRPPVITCPNCDFIIVMKSRTPLLFSDLDTALFRCDPCDHEIKREIKRDAHWARGDPYHAADLRMRAKAIFPSLAAAAALL